MMEMKIATTVAVVMSMYDLRCIIRLLLVLSLCMGIHGTIISNPHYYIPRELNLSNPEEYVNILGGTDSSPDFSHGNSLPLIALPWGFNNYAPQTDNDPNYLGWWFHPSDHRYFGLRVTHQPSPWIKDYGNFIIKAYMPKALLNDSSDDLYTSWAPQSTEFRPYYFQTTMLSYSTSSETTVVEFTPTSHGGIMQVRFPKYDASEVGFMQTRRIAIVLNGESSSDRSYVSSSDDDGAAMLSGHTSINNGGVGDTDDTDDTDAVNGGAFAHFFVATLYGGPMGDVPLKLNNDNSYAGDGSSIVWIDFDAAISDLHELITIRFATSFISIDQAQQNMRTEVPIEKSFKDVLFEAKMAWNHVLSRVKITSIDGLAIEDGNGDTTTATTTIPASTKYSLSESIDLMTTFYSSLYRTSLFPRSLSEYSKEGAEIHWSPYYTSPGKATGSSSSSTDRIGKGPLSTDSGFWDAWNTVYPLLSLFNRPMLGRLLQGWVNAYEEGGWLPQWASPGYRDCMIGTMSDVPIADAIVNEIPGFDIYTAYEAIRKDAFEIPTEEALFLGRACMDSYLSYGYIPQGDCSAAVSRTMNYWQSDYAVAQAAIKLGHNDDAHVLSMRSLNYSLLFDKETGFFRSRSKDTGGKFTTPFDEYAWGGDYTEAGPWQYRFYVPYDPSGLSMLYASSGRSMCDTLELVHTAPLSTFHTGGFTKVTHEMTELAVNSWGQYAHNNQPSHHMLYMYMYEGYASTCASKGQARIRQTLTTLYKPSVDMFIGDEDNGEMGAWYVLSALGLYSRSPGSGVYSFGSPLFGRVEIDISDIAYSSTIVDERSDGNSSHRSTYRTMNEDDSSRVTLRKILIVEAINNGRENMYVQSILWNDVLITGDTEGIKYSLLREGGTLTFIMGPHHPV